MSRSSLKFLAILLSVLIVAVLLSGLDDLPREVRAQIKTERAALATAQSQLHAEKDAVNRDVAADPALFHAITESAQWPSALSRDEAALADASRDMDELTRLEKANRRQDRQRVETLLAHERSLRTSATTDAANVQKEATHWVEWKQHLPEAVRQMESDYHTVHTLDLAPVAAAVAEGRDRLAAEEVRPRFAHGFYPRADLPIAKAPGNPAPMRARPPRPATTRTSTCKPWRVLPTRCTPTPSNSPRNPPK